MAVTKRTRFEVLRRDDHTCQYCGAKAPDVVLHIDHVMPVSLGGDDKPGNLVTACKDCNAGKSSITPDSPLVAGLSDRAAAYALGMQDKMTRFRADIESLDDYSDSFLELWNSWNFIGKDEKIPLPDDYELSLLRWSVMGVPIRVFELAIARAMKKTGIRGEHGVFQYMAGIVTSMINEREIDLTVTEDTAAVYTESQAQDINIDGYMAGCASEEKRIKQRTISHDILRNHIDGTKPEVNESGYYTGKVVRVGAGTRKYPG